jgi:rod shape-determining protein MreC
MKRLTLVALVLFVVAVGGLFSLGPKGTQEVQTRFLGFIALFLKTGSGLERKITALSKGLATLQELEAENKRLSVENKELKAVNQTLRNMEAENNKLRVAMRYQERATFKLVPARVIARDASSWWNSVRIDRGRADGIRDDQAVLTENGLVGKTANVGEDTATVLLLSDENCRVATAIEGAREQAIVSGERTSDSAHPALSLRFLPKTANLKPGQKVYSSGVGGVYPAGIFIGTIKEFQVRELGGYASLQPAVDFTALDDLFIVTGTR